MRRVGRGAVSDGGSPPRPTSSARASGQCRSRALPRARAAPVRRRAPVPPCADRGSSMAAASRSSSNRVSGGTPACLFNSFNFDFARLRRFARRGARMVHRVDGPIGVYRGSTTGRTRGSPASTPSSRRRRSSSRISRSRSTASSGWSSATRWSSRTPSTRRSSTLLRAASRSRGGGSGWSRRAGRTTPARAARRSPGSTATSTMRASSSRSRAAQPAAFERVRVVGPLGSDALAALLRTQDVYLAPSRDDPCSNALLEALACGLPAAYRVERRASRARRRRRPALSGGRGARRACSIGSSSSSTGAGRRSRPVRSPGSRTATSRSSACAQPPRLPRRWRTTCDGGSVARASGSASGSTVPPSRAPTTCSTCRTRGPTRPGSALRR